MRWLRRMQNDKRRRAHVTDDMRIAIAEQYTKGVDARTIAANFGVSPTSVWRSCRRLGVSNGKPLGPRPNGTPLQVTVDSQDSVISAVPVSPVATAVWVVRFEGESEVAAESIDQALHAVRRMHVARRIFHVHLKSGRPALNAALPS